MRRVRAGVDSRWGWLLVLGAGALLSIASEAPAQGREAAAICADTTVAVDRRIESCRARLLASPDDSVAIRHLARALFEEVLTCADHAKGRARRVQLEAFSRCKAANAILALDEALAIHPKDHELYASRGLLLLMLDRPREARANFETVVRLAPRDYQHHRLLAQVLRRTGLRAEEIDAWRALVHLAPDSGAFRAELGAALTRNGHHVEALEELARAEVLGSDAHLELHFHRGEAQLALGQHAEALASYEASIARNPVHPPSWGGRARALHRLGRHAEAVASWERARAVDAARSAREYFLRVPEERREYERSVEQAGYVPAAEWERDYIIGALRIRPRREDGWRLDRRSTEGMLFFERRGSEIAATIDKFSVGVVVRAHFPPPAWHGVDSVSARALSTVRDLLLEEFLGADSLIVRRRRQWTDSISGMQRRWVTYHVADPALAMTRSPLEKAGGVVVIIPPDAERTRTVYMVMVMQYYDARYDRPDPDLLASLANAARPAR